MGQRKANITKEEIEEMNRLRREGITQVRVAKMMGIGLSSVVRYTPRVNEVRAALKEENRQSIIDHYNSDPRMTKRRVVKETGYSKHIVDTALKGIRLHKRSDYVKTVKRKEPHKLVKHKGIHKAVKEMWDLEYTMSRMSRDLKVGKQRISDALADLDLVPHGSDIRIKRVSERHKDKILVNIMPKLDAYMDADDDKEEFIKMMRKKHNYDKA